MKTPGLRARGQRLENACKRYAEDKRITELDNLIKITKDVFGVDRAMMYDCLLDACINVDDAERAVGVWTQMQEENVEPRDEFLWKLGKFLESKNRTVPFAIPDEETVQREVKLVAELAVAKRRTTSPTERRTTSPTEEHIRLALQEQNLDKALEIKPQ